MRLFINDIPVRIVNTSKDLSKEFYHDTIDANQELIQQNRLVHHVLIVNMNIPHLDQLMNSLHKYILTNLYSLTIVVSDLKEVTTYLNKKYKLIKAAGGLVRKKDKILMIYRLKKWDLPKGKLEKGEEPENGAIREVEEECNIKVKLKDPICTTYHTYTMKNKNILKKTAWYSMDCVDDSKRRPQKEEDIEELKWMNPKAAHHALQNSYQSIAHVFNQYYSSLDLLKDHKEENH